MSPSNLNRLHSVNTYHKYWQARTQRQFTHDNNIHLNNTKYTETSLSYTHAYWTHTHMQTCRGLSERQADRMLCLLPDHTEEARRVTVWWSSWKSHIFRDNCLFCLWEEIHIDRYSTTGGGIRLNNKPKLGADGKRWIIFHIQQYYTMKGLLAQRQTALANWRCKFTLGNAKKKKKRIQEVSAYWVSYTRGSILTTGQGQWYLMTPYRYEQKPGNNWFEEIKRSYRTLQSHHLDWNKWWSTLPM